MRRQCVIDKSAFQRLEWHTCASLGELSRHSTVPRVAGCEIGTHVFACAQHHVYRIRVSKRAARAPLTTPPRPALDCDCLGLGIRRLWVGWRSSRHSRHLATPHTWPHAISTRSRDPAAASRPYTAPMTAPMTAPLGGPTLRICKRIAACAFSASSLAFTASASASASPHVPPAPNATVWPVRITTLPSGHPSSSMLCCLYRSACIRSACIRSACIRASVHTRSSMLPPVLRSQRSQPPRSPVRAAFAGSPGQAAMRRERACAHTGAQAWVFIDGVPSVPHERGQSHE